ncbi:hypothetical protein BS50DRAFT_339064 [Corynespora cassiicola Philippines]|uniref:Uncharacterized protein n=1 Tax=Corynespora cassiicola Philippines TaxID=1448308 RepID=A0A2T2NVI6_CORCC|nr:hypothetical protein BS50DRAFT_339064 [Corynespora cassiicola Philippines]
MTCSLLWRIRRRASCLSVTSHVKLLATERESPDSHSNQPGAVETRRYCRRITERLVFTSATSIAVAAHGPFLGLRLGEGDVQLCIVGVGKDNAPSIKPTYKAPKALDAVFCISLCVSNAASQRSTPIRRQIPAILKPLQRRSRL